MKAQWMLLIVLIVLLVACGGPAPTPDTKSLEATIEARLIATQTAIAPTAAPTATRPAATQTAIANAPYYAEIVARWNAVAAGVTVDIPSFGRVNFLWEDDRFPHPTFKGGSPQAYGAFAKVLLAFFEQGDNFDYLAANRLFTVNLRYGTQPTPGWTFAELADLLSRPDGFGSQDDATRKALKSFSDRIKAFPMPPTPTPALPTATPLPLMPTPVPPAPTTTSTNPLAALTKAIRAWSSVKTFRARLTVPPVPPGQGQGGGGVVNIEVVMPDRFHMVGDGNEVILIGSTTYRKINNQWQRGETFIPSPLVDPKVFEAFLAAIKPDVKLLGPEVLDGTPTLVYELTTPLLPAKTSKFWIAVSDGLPRKYEETSADNPLSKMTIIYSDYNADITINPPIP